MSHQVVDPIISRVKFNRELKALRRLRTMHRARGWWLLAAEFPVIEVAFATPRMRPAAIAFAVRIDFTNYDLWPPSVKFIDPFTGQELTSIDQVISPMLRMTQSGPQRIVQSHIGQPPFICLPGVREYHEHPGHNGDDWLLHRGKGEGNLLFLLDKLSTYGSEPLAGWQILMQPILQQGEVPA